MKLASAAAALPSEALVPERRALPALRALDALGLVVLVGLAAALRIVGIANNTDVSDEGIRGIQLRLMAAGFHPVSEIYASQGPLSLLASYPLYVLLGGDIGAARLAVAAYSVVGIVTVYWLARQLAGPTAGLAAGLMLAVGPVYLENSRLALVEVPSLVPALVGLAFVVRYRSGGGRAWLVGSAVLLATGVLIKPMAAMVGASALVLIAAPKHGVEGQRSNVEGSSPFDVGPLISDRVLGAPAARRRRGADLLTSAVAALAVGTAVVAWAGPTSLYDQMVAYRLGARTVGEWDLATNWAVVSEELGREGLGLAVAAALGAAVLVRRRTAEAVALLAWLCAGLALFIWYSPLRPKHIVYLVPPLALFGGVAAAWAVQAATSLARRTRPSGWGVVCLAGVALYLGTLPALAADDGHLIGRQSSSDALRFADDLRVVAAASQPDEFIVMDDAYLALLTGRLLPPTMADLSWTRIRARTLSSDAAKAETERFGARAIVIQDDHLGQLPRYVEWVDRNYLLVKSYVQRVPKRYRRVYVRRDVDLAAVRAALAAGIETPIRAEIGPALLRGYSLDGRDLTSGMPFALTLHWEALVDSPPKYAVILRLRDADRQVAQEIAFEIGDGEQELPSWRAGRWQVQTINVPVDARVRSGSHTLTLALEPPRGPPAAIRAGRDVTVVEAGAELVVGSISVRQTRTAAR